MSPGSYPAGITAGRDGNLWFTEITGNKFCVSRVLANLPDSNKCEAAKLKAAAKAAATVLSCAAKSASKGKPADPSCVLVLPGSKLQPKLDAAVAKADTSGPCAGNSFTLGVVIELACHVQSPIADSAGTVTGLVCS